CGSNWLRSSKSRVSVSLTLTGAKCECGPSYDSPKMRAKTARTPPCRAPGRLCDRERWSSATSSSDHARDKPLKRHRHPADTHTRHPGAGRDPLFDHSECGQVDPGLRWDDVDGAVLIRAGVGEVVFLR